MTMLAVYSFLLPILPALIIAQGSWDISSIRGPSVNSTGTKESVCPSNDPDSLMGVSRGKTLGRGGKEGMA